MLLLLSHVACKRLRNEDTDAAELFYKRIGRIFCACAGRIDKPCADNDPVKSRMRESRAAVRIFGKDARGRVSICRRFVRSACRYFEYRTRLIRFVFVCKLYRQEYCRMLRRKHAAISRCDGHSFAYHNNLPNGMYTYAADPASHFCRKRVPVDALAARIFCIGKIRRSRCKDLPRQIARIFKARIGAPAFTSASMAAAAVLCLPFSLVLAQSYEVHWSWGGVLSVLYLGVGCSWLAYLLWNKGMNKVPANVSGLLISLEPVVGVIMAVWILGEHLSAVSTLGVFIVIAATFVAGWLSNRGKNA